MKLQYKAGTMLKVMAYSGTMELMDAIDKGCYSFGELMRTTQLNPGILNRLLAAGVQTGVIDKLGRSDYHLTTKGVKALHLAREIEKL